MTGLRQAIKRIAAVLGIAVIAMAQIVFVLPTRIDAETAGDVLEVRVQYYGERGDKIRVKASFTRAELEAMGAKTYYYSNVTRVGTVMSMAARGPKVMTIIENAGIDAASIKNITFRTTDGYTRNFGVGTHMTATKYYYPELSSNYERNEAGNAITPLAGAVKGKKTVPAILALEFGESKLPNTKAEDLTLSTKKSYRFCMGQSLLKEGKMTNPNDDGGDVSSMESCHSIYGIDITLSGSPVKGIDLSIDGDIKVGSQKRVSAKMKVDELFAEDYSVDELSWKSSDTSIATVDEFGNVSVKKKGAFTITATAPDGTSASIEINSKEASNNGSEKNSGGEKKSSKTDDKLKNDTKDTVKAVELNAKEIKLGDVIEETSTQDDNRAKMADDAIALNETKPYSRGMAIGTAVGAGLLCGVGALVRIIKYKKFF